MKLKSYFADSVQSAIDQAREELGPDAMLVNSSQTSADLRDLGAWEVVFGVESANGNAPKTETRSHAATPATSEVVLRELAELRKQMESFAASISRTQLSQATEQFAPEVGRVFDRLITLGFSHELARALTEAAAHRLPRDRNDLFTRELLRANLEHELSGRFSVAPQLAEDQAILLVGAPGAGKTSSLVKIALQYGIKAHRPLRLLSLDTLRIGGVDQLSKYARILGTALHLVEDSSGLETALAQNAASALTLIDTPGFGAADEAELDELARVARLLPLEIYLVLPAHTRLDAAERIARRFAVLEPAKLLVTHMDAVSGPAIPIELAIKTSLPLSFFGTGQQVPEDLQEADKTALLEEFTPRERAAAFRAA